MRGCRTWRRRNGDRAGDGFCRDGGVSGARPRRTLPLRTGCRRRTGGRRELRPFGRTRARYAARGRRSHAGPAYRLRRRRRRCRRQRRGCCGFGRGRCSRCGRTKRRPFGRRNRWDWAGRGGRRHFHGNRLHRDRRNRRWNGGKFVLRIRFVNRRRRLRIRLRRCLRHRRWIRRGGRRKLREFLMLRRLRTTLGLNLRSMLHDWSDTRNVRHGSSLLHRRGGLCHDRSTLFECYHRAPRNGFACALLRGTSRNRKQQQCPEYMQD